MIWIRRMISPFRIQQWVLLGIGVILLMLTAVVGVADNPPGMISLMSGIACMVGVLVWHWRSPKSYWILGSIALFTFPVGVILHNLLYALGTVVNQSVLLSGVVQILEILFFLLAVVFVPPVIAVSLIGGIAASWTGVQGLVERNRSYRRFYQQLEIPEKTLMDLLALARVSSSLANRQGLRYILSATPEKNQKIYPTLGWAGYLKDWSGPEEGDRPAAYIIFLGDKERATSFEYDVGIAVENILLGAVERGLGGCIIGSIRRDNLRRVLDIPSRYHILVVLALGYPKEKVVIEPLEPDGSIQYWRDENGVHHVPKRSLDDMLLD